MIRRREVITLLGGAAAAWPASLNAQSPDRVRRIAVLTGFADKDREIQRRLSSFARELQKLGWLEGRNIRIDWRFAGDDVNRARAMANELITLQPEVILAQGAVVQGFLQTATTSIPIVFIQVSDPVRAGFIKSLARPGGNLTGFTAYQASLAGKWLDFLLEIAPKTTRIAMLHNPDQVSSVGYMETLRSLSLSTNLQVVDASVRNKSDIEDFVSRFSHRESGLIVLPDNTTVLHRNRITELATQHRLPAIYGTRAYVQDGGLIFYGADIAEFYASAAGYVDRILKGERPGDLPVQAPTKYELVINLNTAKALGLEVPPALLARADEVIE